MSECVPIYHLLSIKQEATWPTKKGQKGPLIMGHAVHEWLSIVYSMCRNASMPTSRCLYVDVLKCVFVSLFKSAILYVCI